ncbi:MAG: hypothetical protein Q9219_004971 [cf. Caloplaca sp. 3 TL-2023]
MPILYFGGGTVGTGAFSTPEAVNDLLGFLKTANIKHIDSAGIYPAGDPGAAERLLGLADTAGQGFIIDTKVKVTGDGPGQGSLTKEAIETSLTTSLSSLGVASVNTLYCHIPDTVTPVEETAAAMNDLWTDSKFQQIGLSNYSSDQVAEFISVCEERNFKQPGVYQGQYNAVYRNVEKDLLPFLRRHGITFIAFSPLAGGFLTGNLTLGNELKGTRFEPGNPMGGRYRPMYDKAAMHTAIEKLYGLLEPLGVSLAGASLRWLYYHSALGEKDGIILGATKIEQVKQNVAEITKGPLENKLVDAFEQAWKTVSEVAP